MSAGAPYEGLLVESRADGGLALPFQKGLKFTYSTDFLLSMAVLDMCQRLPCGFDSAILCELGDPHQIWSQPKTDTEFARWDCNILPTSWKNTPESGTQGKNNPDSGILGKNTSESGILGKNTSESEILGKNNPESGVLGKGALLRAPESKSVDSAPKIREGSSCHLLTRSATPYRPPHLYKINLHPEILEVDTGSEKAVDSLRSRKTEKERQREASESLWTERQVVQEMQKSMLDDQKENQDPSNAASLAESEKCCGPVEESWTSEKLKGKIGQTTMSCPYFLSWIKPSGNSTSNINGKYGTGEAPIDHTTKLNEQPLTSIPSESNADTSQFNPSISSAAKDAFQHEGDRSTISPNPSEDMAPTTEHKRDNPEIDDADYQYLIALLDEEITCQSTELRCSQDLSMLGFYEFDLGGHRPIPASCDDDIVPPSEVDASSHNETVLKGNEHVAEVSPELSTEQETLLDPAASDSHEEPCTSDDEICWPDEDSLITIDDFLCPTDEASSGQLSKNQSSSPQLLGSQIKPEKKMKSKRVYAPKPMRPRMPPPPPPGMGPWFPGLPLPSHPMHPMTPYPPGMWSPPFGNQIHIYTNMWSSPDQDLGWPWFGNS